MPSFLKIKDRWRCQLCVNGKRISRTFPTKREAQAWASEEETNLRQNKSGDIPDKSFADLMNRYSREVSIKKRGKRREQQMIAVILRDPVASMRLPALRPADIAEWRDRRLGQVSGATVDREMNILTHACNVAVREWGWLQVNPCSHVSRPAATPSRTRRPSDAETEKLLFMLGDDVSTISGRVGLAYRFAIETAMRAGEICSLSWAHVDERHVHLPKTKNGHARDVPLSSEARGIIDQLRGVDDKRVFLLKPSQIDANFRKARDKALIEDLHFHDTRREALTRLSKIFNVMELAKISGHRDLRILQNVYYAPTVHDLADKLD